MFDALNTQIISIAQIERDPTMLPRINEFVKNSFPVVADPDQITRKDFEIFHVYLIDKEGNIRTHIPGEKEARPRLDLIISELAKLEGVEPPAFKNVTGHIDVAGAKSGTFAQDLAGEAVTDVRWMWSHNMIRPGDAFKLAFVVDIAEGYHLYGNNEERLTPFKIDFELPNGIEWAKPYEYPAAKTKDDPVLKVPLSVFDRVIAMPTMRLKASEELAEGDLTVKATIHYQSCNTTTCNPPTTKTLDLPLKVVSKKANRGTVAGSQLW